MKAEKKGSARRRFFSFWAAAGHQQENGGYTSHSLATRWHGTRMKDRRGKGKGKKNPRLAPRIILKKSN